MEVKMCLSGKNNVKEKKKEEEKEKERKRRKKEGRIE